MNRVQIHGSPRCHSTPRPRPSRPLASWRVGFPPPSPRPRSQRESAADRVWDGYLVIQPGTRHTVAPESLHQTQAGPDSRINGAWCCPDRELCEGSTWFECNSRTVHGVERTILVRCWRNGYRSRLRRLRPETLPGIGHRASCLGSRPCSDHHCRRAPESQWSCPRCRLLRHGRHRHGRGNDVVALRRTVLHAICVVRRSACRVLHRRSESDHVAIWVDVRALMLAPVSVFWQADIRPCGLPRPREFIGILDKEICRGARIGSVHKSKMNLDTVQGGIAVPATFVLPCREAKSLVMRKRGVEVTDWK